MKTLRLCAGLRDKRKADVQNYPAKYWGTWTDEGSKRLACRSDGSVSVDKTAGFHSRPHKKEELRQANRAITKSARRMLKQQLAEDVGNGQVV